VTNLNQPKAIPLNSVGFDDPHARANAIDRYYLKEIDRQAEIAALGIHSAIFSGCATRNPHDAQVWASLQTVMFSAICIARLLKPGKVLRPYPGKSLAESQQHANARGCEG
jgi:hypothetical protein